MEDIILNFRRKLIYIKDGKYMDAELSIPKIVYLPERNQWGCHWSIPMIKPKPEQHSVGDDPIEALMLVFYACAELFHGIPGLEVRWQNEGDNGGFPRFQLPKSEIRLS